jgi:hypothetical protein
MGHRELLGWTLVEPIALCDSRDHPSIQLADVLAGTAVACAGNALPEGNALKKSIVANFIRHLHPDTIWPDMELVDPTNRSAAVSALILYDLAKRAERGGNPYENLSAIYHLAEVEWAKGNFPWQAEGGRKS